MSDHGIRWADKERLAKLIDFALEDEGAASDDVVDDQIPSPNEHTEATDG